MKNVAMLVIVSILSNILLLSTGCCCSSSYRVTGYSGFRYVWNSMICNDGELTSRFGPILVEKKFQIQECGFEAAGSFWPYSPDGYYLELRGFVPDAHGGWMEDIVFPWEEQESKTKLFLASSKAKFRIVASQTGRVIADKTVCVSDAMRARPKFARQVFNSYPVFFIATKNLDPAEAVTLRVIVMEPDMSFSGFDGYISIYVFAHVHL